MHIKITDTEAYQSAIRFYELFWKAYAKKKYTFILIYFGIGIGLLTYDIVYFDNPSWYDNADGDSKPINLHLGIGIGIAFLYLVYFLLVRFYKEKKKFTNIFYEGLSIMYQPSNTRKIIFNDDSIIFESDQCKSETKWMLITAFAIYKDYLIIYNYDHTVFSTIHKTLMSDSDYSALLTFLRQWKREIKGNAFPFYN